MNPLYSPLLVIHVLIAVLGIGSIASVAVLAATARAHAPESISKWLAPLLRYSAFSLAGMLMTGVLLDLAAHGAFHQSWWFRGSALMLIATGGLHGLTRRSVRSGLTGNGGVDGALRRVERMAYGMCALVAAITMLMEVKPF